MTARWLALFFAPTIFEPSFPISWLDASELRDLLSVDSTSVAIGLLRIEVRDGARDGEEIALEITYQGRAEHLFRSVPLGDVPATARTRTLALAIEGLALRPPEPPPPVSVTNDLELTALAAARFPLGSSPTIGGVRAAGGWWMGPHRFAAEFELATATGPTQPSSVAPVFRGVPQPTATLRTVELGLSYQLGLRFHILQATAGVVIVGGLGSVQGNSSAPGLAVASITSPLLAVGLRGELALRAGEHLLFLLQADLRGQLAGLEGRFDGTPLVSLSGALVSVALGLGLTL